MKLDNHGTYVTKLNAQEIENSYAVRLSIEPEAAARAYVRMEERDYFELAARLEDMRRAGERKDYLNASKTDLAFHRIIWKLSGSGAFERALNAASLSLFAASGLYLIGLFSRTPSDFEAICNDHWTLLNALKKGGPDEVRRAFREKLEIFRRQNLRGARLFEATQQKDAIVKTEPEVPGADTRPAPTQGRPSWAPCLRCPGFAPAMKAFVFLFVIATVSETKEAAITPPSEVIALLREGKVQQALPLLKDFVKAHPRSAEGHKYYGLALERQGAIQEAATEFRAAAALNPNDPETEKDLGVALAQTGDMKGAILALRVAARQRPRWAGPHIELGKLYAQAGDKTQALVEAQEAVTTDPNSAEAHNSLGVALRQSDDLEGAVREFRRAVSIDANSVPALKNLAQAMQVESDWEAAVELNRRLTALEPSSGAAHANLGYVLMRADQLTESLGELREAVKFSPALAAAHFYLGEALARAGDSAAALEEYEKASRFNPKDAQYHLKLGVALFQYRPQDAINELKRSIQLDPNDVTAHRTLAVLLGRTGDLKGASSESQKARELALAAERQSEAMVHIKAASQELKKNNFRHAIDEARLALAAEPDSSQANLLLGIGLSALGEWSEARRAFMLALQDKPSDPEFLFNFGVFLGLQRDFQGAAREFRSVLEVRPYHHRAHCLLASALAHLGDAAGSNRELKEAQELGPCDAVSGR